MRNWEGDERARADKDNRKVTERKANYVNQDYPIEEAKRLVVKNSVLKNPTPLEVGIRRVAEFIIKG